MKDRQPPANRHSSRSTHFLRPLAESTNRLKFAPCKFSAFRNVKKITRPGSVVLVLAGVLYLVGCKPRSESLTPEQAREIAKEAYIYGFPLVMNYKTMYLNAIDKNSGDYKGEFNQVACEARLYTPEDKAIVTVNADTPYCMFWSDIRDEPLVFSVPDVDSGRYYSFQFIDLYTHNFAYLGSLTQGNKAGKYLIATENWEGEVPDGIADVFRCETGIFFTIVRTQLIDAEDLKNVERLQQQYQVQLLSEYLGKNPIKKDRSNAFPAWVEGSQFSEASFQYLDVMLDLIDPIAEELPLIGEFKKLGLGTEDDFDLTKLDPEVRSAIEQGVKDGFVEMEAFIKSQSGDPLGSSKIFGTRKALERSARENYGFENIYLIRAVAAHLGIYGNSASEAIYPAFLVDGDGKPMNASEGDYTLTFGPSQLPPVRAFWSLTMYDGKTQLLVDNPLNRYLINSSMKDDFVWNEDGSLTIYLQNKSPGKGLQGNWLPAPDGPFYAIMRLYGPTEAVLNGVWTSPKIVKQSDN